MNTYNQTNSYIYPLMDANFIPFTNINLDNFIDVVDINYEFLALNIINRVKDEE